MKFCYAIHPHVSGTIGMARLLDDFLDHARRREGVWFPRAIDIEFLEQRRLRLTRWLFRQQHVRHEADQLDIRARQQEEQGAGRCAGKQPPGRGAEQGRAGAGEKHREPDRDRQPAAMLLEEA